MTLLSANQLSKIFPNNKEIAEWLAAIERILPKYEINTSRRLAAFLSQTGHESLDYTVLTENLNYGENALNTVFPKYFKNSGRDAAQYARQPEKIANIVYANRMGNGDTASGEGWKFRGRGIIQLTGKDNYTTFGKTIGKTADEVIQYLQTKDGAIESAAWFWTTRNINSPADKEDTIAVTKLINGGTHGIDDRTARYKKIIGILSTDKSTDSTHPTTIVETKSETTNDATFVQQYLKIPVTGKFDAYTVESLKKWQKYNNLVADGIAGPKTLAKMKL